jgi:hypothetical protein
MGCNRSSGVRVYYTKKLRPYETGMLVFGDLYMHLEGTPLFDGLSNVQITCEDAFSRCGPKDKIPITIFSSQLHMHVTGVKMAIERVCALAASAYNTHPTHSRTRPDACPRARMHARDLRGLCAAPRH